MSFPVFSYKKTAASIFKSHSLLPCCALLLGRRQLLCYAMSEEVEPLRNPGKPSPVSVKALRASVHGPLGLRLVSDL